jgi:putative membrane protein
MEQYYKRYRDKLILRDVLAADRTQMANERTLLSYYRTALTLFIAGVSFIKFFDSIIIVAVGWIFTPLGFLVAGIGTSRFLKMKKPLDSLMTKAHDDQRKTDEATAADI